MEFITAAVVFACGMWRKRTKCFGQLCQYFPCGKLAMCSARMFHANDCPSSMDGQVMLVPQHAISRCNHSNLLGNNSYNSWFTSRGFFPQYFVGKVTVIAIAKDPIFVWPSSGSWDSNFHHVISSSPIVLKKSYAKFVLLKHIQQLKEQLTGLEHTQRPFSKGFFAKFPFGENEHRHDMRAQGEDCSVITLFRHN